MMRTAFMVLQPAIAAALLAMGPTAQAQDARGHGFGAPVAEQALDGLRGGFESGGLRLSFGVERATYVNGQLVARDGFALPDLRQVTPEQARHAAAVLGSTQWLRDGQALRITDGALAGSGATLIQNTLDQQVLQQLTTLQLRTSALGDLKGLNALGSLRDALAAPLRGR
jgi:hypothetical protein